MLALELKHRMRSLQGNIYVFKIFLYVFIIILYLMIRFDICSWKNYITCICGIYLNKTQCYLDKNTAYFSSFFVPRSHSGGLLKYHFLNEQNFVFFIMPWNFKMI